MENENELPISAPNPNQEPPSLLDRFNDWFKTSITVKMIIIFILILILLIPSSYISSLVYERKSRAESVIHEISDKWGNEQAIGGPVLSIPYSYTYKDDKGSIFSAINYAHFLPEELTVVTQMNPEIRHRSIFQAILYLSKSTVKGNFKKPDFSKLNVAPADIHWNEAFLSFGLSDMRGIGDKIVLKWNQQELVMNSSIPTNQVFSEGVSIPVNLSDDTSGYNFETNITLKGSKNLNFIPIGKETDVTVSSDWETPSYDGAFLPDRKDSMAKGFKAHWKVLDLNRNFPQQWLGDISASNTNETDFVSLQGFYTPFTKSAFGVRLIEQVDEYQKNERSVKYAVLFIFLTFLLFFFIELTRKQNLHALQYLLIGAAICIFYVLLISLSEHFGFNLAYAIAAAATSILIAAYTKGIMGSWKVSIITGGIVSLLYGFLFYILQSEDNALLIGSVGLFIILAVVMYFSRKINTLKE